jgi:hypothetical protein
MNVLHDVLPGIACATRALGMGGMKRLEHTDMVYVYGNVSAITTSDTADEV